jgi:hypothetical protein
MPEFILEMPAAVPTSSTGDVVEDDGTTDQVATALSRLPQQFRSSAQPNIEAFMRMLASPLQDFQRAALDVLLLRTIDTAIGAQLDWLGRIVGQSRDGVVDDELYRRYLRARISTNRSKGRFADLIKISRLVVDEDALRVVVTNEGTATVRVRLADIAVADDAAAILILFLRKAKSAGVRLILEYSTHTPLTTFTLDTGPGLNVGHLATALE